MRWIDHDLISHAPISATSSTSTTHIGHGRLSSLAARKRRGSIDEVLATARVRVCGLVHEARVVDFVGVEVGVFGVRVVGMDAGFAVHEEGVAGVEGGEVVEVAVEFFWGEISFVFNNGLMEVKVGGELTSFLTALAMGVLLDN